MGWFSWMKPEKQTEKKSLMVSVRTMLGGAAPGAWASDHREESKHFTGFNYLAIHAIANQVAGATVTVFDDSERGFAKQSKRKSIRSIHGSLAKYKSTYGADDRETDPLPATHPLVKLLKKPNPFETGSQFRYKQAQQIRLTGTCLIWNLPNKAGKTIERYILPTSQCTPVMPTAEMPLGGWRVSGAASRYIPLDDQGFVEGSPSWTNILGKVIDATQVQVIRLPHPWWYDDGQSPISAGAMWVDAEQAINTARIGQMRNGADPSLVWKLPPDCSPDQDEVDRVTHKINQKYAGPDNVGRVMVVQAGTDVTPVTTAPKDMGYSEGFADTKAACLALHGTPEVATGFAPSGAYAAYTMSMKAWRHATVQPLCDMLAESDTEHLAPQFGDNLTVEIESAQVDDAEQTEKMLANDIAAGNVRKVNEYRSLRGLPPLDGPEGDEFVGKANEAKANGNGNGLLNDQPEQPDPSLPDTPFSRKSYRAAYDAARDVDEEALKSRSRVNTSSTKYAPKPLDQDSEIQMPEMSPIGNTLFMDV